MNFDFEFTVEALRKAVGDRLSDPAIDEPTRFMLGRTDQLLKAMALGSWHAKPMENEHRQAIEAIGRSLIDSLGMNQSDVLPPSGQSDNDGTSDIDRTLRSAVEALCADKVSARQRECIQALALKCGSLENEILEREAARTTNTPPESARQSVSAVSYTKAKLTNFIRSKGSEWHSATIDAITVLNVGGTKDTIIAVLKEPVGSLQRLVFRVDRPVQLTRTSVVDEFELLQYVYAAKLPIPHPLWLETSGEVLGQPFVVMEHVDGSVPSLDPDCTTGLTPTICQQMATFLAELHNLPIPHSAVRGARFSDFSERLRYFYDWYISLARAPSIVVDSAFAWLMASTSLVDGPRVLVHGDFNHRNLMLADGKLSAVLDWETWQVGHRAEDLAYCRPGVSAVMPWVEFLAMYERAGGTPVHEDALKYCELWSYARNCVYLVTAESEYRSGRTNNFFCASVGPIELLSQTKAAARVLAQISQATRFQQTTE